MTVLPLAELVPRAGGPSPLLELRDLSVSFPVQQGEIRPVNGLDLKIGRGETVALVGESGSGKSITSLAVMRLLPPQARIQGQILWHDDKGLATDFGGLSARAMRSIRGNDIAMIFQEPMTSLNPLQTAGQQIVEAIRLHRRMPRADATAQAISLLELVGIPEPKRRLGNLPHEMSGGIRQRIMIAMALACRPSLLIADEPTTALDVTVQAQILHLIRRFQRELGMSVLFITHDLGVVAEIAERMIVLYAGRVVETGTVRQVLSSPLHPYTKGLLNSVPRVRDPSHRLDAIPGMVPEWSNMPPGCAFAPRCRHAVSGRCDVRLPMLEPAGADRDVRCLRWQELAETRQ
ncbi:MAG: ABC transporter ATP-binding protein [Rhizobiaceae bacterium]|nr:ABC transporter ATP-binding protein [Rhizobiaceae bacterium]